MFGLSEEMIYKIVEQIDDIKDLFIFGRTNRQNKCIVDNFITQILPTPKGAKWVIAQFEKYISLDSKKCLELTNCIRKLGIVELWKNQIDDNPFILIAFLLTIGSISEEQNHGFTRG
jgi:hypothetical protein